MFNDKFMQMALSMAKIAFENGEVPVGAVIIDPETAEVLGKSHNLVEQRQDPTAHAEMLSIQAACSNLSNKYLTGLDLYVTLQPCMMCLQAAIYARVRRIYFGAYDPSSPLTIPANSNHNLEVYGGICEAECKELLDSFFSEKRSSLS